MNKFSMIIGVSKMLAFEITGCNDPHLRFLRIPLRHDLKEFPSLLALPLELEHVFSFFSFLENHPK